MNELSEDEKRFIDAVGSRLPSRCHVWVTNLGIPVIIMLLAWIGAEAVWARDTVRDAQHAIAGIKITLDRHESLLRSMNISVASLWTLQTKSPIAPMIGTPP